MFAENININDSMIIFTCKSNLYEQCQNSNISFLPKMVVLDFEMAAINAFREFFVDADNNWCRFHWSQSVFCKIAGIGLKKNYSDNNNEIGQCLKLYFGLPLLPPEEVKDAFAYDIMPNAESTPAIKSFADYVFDTYISVDNQYPPEM